MAQPLRDTCRAGPRHGRRSNRPWRPGATPRPRCRLPPIHPRVKSSNSAPRQFTARLHLEHEGSPQLVRYNVLGRNPAWVFRLEDYEAIAHWEMDMSEPAPGADRGTK